MDMDIYLDNFNEEEDVDFLGVDFLIPENDEKLVDPKKNHDEDESLGVIEPQNVLPKISPITSPNGSPSNETLTEDLVLRPQASKPVKIQKQSSSTGGSIGGSNGSGNGSYSSFGKGSFESPLFAMYAEEKTSKSYTPGFQGSVFNSKIDNLDDGSLSFFSSSWSDINERDNNKFGGRAKSKSVSIIIEKDEEKHNLHSKRSQSFSVQPIKRKNVWDNVRKKERKKERTVSFKPKDRKDRKSSFFNISKEHPLGEEPRRTLFVRNISSYIEDSELRKVFEPFGDISSLYSSCKHRGFVMISYFDVRAAKKAKENLINCYVQNRKIDVHYSIPKNTGNDAGTIGNINHGIAILRKLPENVKDSELRNILKEYGEIDKIEKIKDNGRKVWFFDLRNSEKCVNELNGKEIRGALVEVSYGEKDKKKRKSMTYKNSPMKEGNESGKLAKIFSSSVSNGGNLSAIMKNRQDLKRGSGSYKPMKIQTRRRYRSNVSKGSFFDKSNFKIIIERVKNDKDLRTTLMIRNIPNKYNRKMLMATIDKKFKDLYNFLYLPIDFQNKCNMGYAFINLVSHKTIPSLCKEFMGKKWEKFNSEKICQLTYARIQGKEKLQEHFKNSSVNYMEKSLKPVFY